MLRIYFLQQWFDLSDPGAEEALYGSVAMRGFVRLDLGREPAPVPTTSFQHASTATFKSAHTQHSVIAHG
jgi:IS5 family transposase